MRFLFFVLGVPMMIMSFFQVNETLPFVQDISLDYNGQEVVLSQEQTQQLGEQIENLFQNSITLPALSVVFADDFNQLHSDGTYITLKFGQTITVNDLPFDELMFKVDSNVYGFNCFRGNSGVFQGRCIYVDLNGKTMEEFAGFVNNLVGNNA